MNIQLHTVISDITGVSGLRIIRAILQGQRNVHELAELKDHRAKTDKETIAKSLQGDYRTEHLFCLQQELDLYMTYHQKILECDQRIEQFLALFQSKIDPRESPLGPSKRGKRKAIGNQPSFDLRFALYRITGVDLTAINGLDASSIQTILSEIGLDLTRWPNEKHFASWLGLSPNNRITGERIQSSHTRKGKNRAAYIFRIAAQSLSNSHSALGAYFRRIKIRIGAPKAITAAAHKLACIFYRMLKNKMKFKDRGMDYYEERYKNRVLHNLKRRATDLGYELVQKEPLVSGAVS